ncbi:MAG: ASKHA domain-containing protein [Treponema sp.]|nr:ASKHA domain-containing protein [Treponema sp.]
MPKITFLPDNIAVEKPECSSLLEAARNAGVFVETPCGGNGTCQKCLVVINGKQVLICQTAVPGEDITVEVKNNGPCLTTYKWSGAINADYHGLNEESLNIISGNLRKSADKFLIDNDEIFLKSIKITVPAPALLDGLSDSDRFKRAFLKIFEQKAECRDVALPLNILATLPEKLRESDGSLEMFYYIEKNTAKIISSSLSSYFGIAIDIGTTTVALWLVDLKTKKIISTHNAYNSQIECGLDVISRINFAKKNLNELKTRILKTINELIQDACKDAGIEQQQILYVSIAGNTVMTHLLLGIVPEYIRLSPYTPAVFQPQVYTAAQIGILANDNAPVIFAPAVGSYVGGDITAGLLCTELAQNTAQGIPPGELILFIDIGTNGEIVIGNNDFIFACACSAGPAFEGGGIKYGVRASSGAIEKVSINKNGEPEISTIGDKPPIGICGSGIISAIAELFRKGIIDSAGKFLHTAGNVKNSEYILCGGISINEADIENFIRAKGAIFSACQTMLNSIGMSFKDVSKVYVAGGFGRFLDLEDARTIGLLPRLPDENYTFLGNSSCLGAYLSLVSEEYRAKLHEIAKKITYVDLSNEPKYMDHYTGALFLPHTDRTLFE